MTWGSFKNMWKEPIYKEDLPRILGYGFLVMIAFSILGGALQFVCANYLGFTFSIFVYLIGYMVGKTISKYMPSFHILYPFVGVLYFIIGYILYNVAFYSFLTHEIPLVLKEIFSSNFLNYCFTFFNPSAYASDIVSVLFDLFIFIIGAITAYQIPYRRKF